MPPRPSTEADAYELLERLRWGGSPAVCPHCGTAGRCYFLRPRDGRPRATRTGAATHRRVWKCAACRRQFSVLAGTVLEGTRISLRAWAGVLVDWPPCGTPPTAAELAERHGLTRAAARHVARRLALAVQLVPAQLDGAARAAALLSLPTAEAARIRERTPTRVRPRRQLGSTADYGTG